MSALGFGVGLGFKQRPAGARRGGARARLPGVRGALRDAVPGDHPLRRQLADRRRGARLPPPHRAPALPRRRAAHAAARARDGRPAGAVPRRQRGARSAPTGGPRSSPASRRSSALLRRGLRPAARADRARGRRLARRRDAGRHAGRPGDALARAGEPAPRLHRQAREAGGRGDGAAARRDGAARATSCATRSRRSRRRCSRRRWSPPRRATCCRWRRARRRSGSTSRSPPGSSSSRAAATAPVELASVRRELVARLEQRRHPAPRPPARGLAARCWCRAATTSVLARCRTRSRTW